MIFVGIDDTDTLDDPGTNQLARHLARKLADVACAKLITRHQLFEHPLVPCTKHNGCVVIEFDLCDSASESGLIARIRELMLAWCPRGSDPGLCVARDPIPGAIVAYGRDCQRQLMTQGEARQLAVEHGLYLEGLGGTQDGVIGALAAVGLINTRDDGRVIYVGSSAIDYYDIGGLHSIDELRDSGIDSVVCRASEQLVATGTVDVGKRLRPNYRAGRVVLYVSPLIDECAEWRAERVV